MRKKLLLVAVLAANLYYAQQDGRVGINTTTPTTTLDVNGKTDSSGVSLATDATGLQAPRLTRAELTAKGELLYTLQQKGALVYITNVTGGNTSGQRANVTTEGYYYFDGASWVKITTGASSGVATADNGLTMSTASNTQLGGTLLKATTVALNNFVLKFDETATNNGKMQIGAKAGGAVEAPTEKLRLDVDGYTRTDKLLVGGTGVTTAAANIRNEVSTESIMLLTGTNSDSSINGGNPLRKFEFTNDGKLSIAEPNNYIATSGTTRPTESLDVGGNVRFRGVPAVDGTTVLSATTDKMMVLAADGTGKLYPLPATVKKVSPEQTGNFTFTASDDWDVILYNKASGANAVLTLPVTGVAPGKTVYVTNAGLGSIDVPSSILRGAPPSPNISAGASVTFVFLGPNGNNKWAQVSGY